jgi:hypothetical protein
MSHGAVQFDEALSLVFPLYVNPLFRGGSVRGKRSRRRRREKRKARARGRWGEKGREELVTPASCHQLL